MPDICTNPLLKGRNKKVYIINQHLNIEEEKILITMIPTASYTVGFTLTFASGTLTIDWKDGSATENFVSGIELMHTYTSASTYVAEITGDLENITKFIADNNRITNIENLVSLIADTTFLNVNLLTSLDLSNYPVKTAFNISNNSSLSYVTFASSGNEILNSCIFNNCSLISMDFSNVNISGVFTGRINPGLSSLVFSPSGNGVLTSFDCRLCDLPDVDFTVFPVSNGVTIQLQSNSFTATEHDNQLINLYNWGSINGNLVIISGNTARTSASDTAYNWLIANGWTIS